MTDDIVTRLRADDCFEFPSCDDVKQEAADEIERLRSQNTELIKMFKQVGIVAEMWQKSEDELIELHHGKCAEQFAKQADEIERLRADVAHWRNIAEQAVDNADQAVKLLEKLTGISRD